MINLSNLERDVLIFQIIRAHQTKTPRQIYDRLALEFTPSQITESMHRLGLRTGVTDQRLERIK